MVMSRHSVEECLGRSRAPAWAGTVALIAAVVLGGGTAPRSHAQPAEPRVVDVTVRRFAFEPAQIDAVVGERLRLAIRSADGVHGVEIEGMNVEREVPRGGKTVSIDITPAKAGRFPILCSEYCGDGHEDMKGLLVVQADGVARR
jgi:cytochrome c oxidase subunit 2